MSIAVLFVLAAYFGDPRWVHRGEGAAMPGNGRGDLAVTLGYPGGEHRMSITRATLGASRIDLGTLRAATGMVTLDPGFVNTAGCAPAITYIDGEAGILRYRGYPIGQLAEHSSFLETSYLLIYGDLPTSDQLENFTEAIRIQGHPR